MINVVYQLLRDENKTTVLSVVLALTLLVSISAVSLEQRYQSGDGNNVVAERDAPVAEKAVAWLEFTDNFSSDTVLDDIAGTPADLAPYSYVFYSQNYFLESIHARTPAAFALLS